MNNKYQNLLRGVLQGSLVETRNHRVYRCVNLPEFTIDKTPLITTRRTAWKKALKELEWFLSGDTKCPDHLLDWWNGQLNHEGHYLLGYGWQWRRRDNHDQIKHLLHSLNHHQNSRRHILTTWSPRDMADVVVANDNPKTPTTCHGTMAQLFVIGDRLHMNHYQRSADMLLGLPHNLMQYWALLLFLSRHSCLMPGTINYKLGDAHIYDEPSHLQAAKEVTSSDITDFDGELVYVPSLIQNTPKFSAEDFYMKGDIPDPICTVRPTLL